MDTSQRRIERRKGPVGDIRAAAVRPREPVEERRLTDVRITDERDEPFVRPSRPPIRPLLTHVVECAAQHRDPPPDLAAIDLELRLARPARPDTAAQTGERGIRTDEVRLTVAQLRELDL